MRWIRPIIVVALVVAGCTSSGETDDAEGGDGTGTSAPSASEPTTGTDPPGSTTAPDTTGAPLTASFRGVTPEVIRVGVAVPDFDALQAAGVDTYFGSAETAYQTFFDQINAEGGIGGRLIEPYYSTFDFLAAESQESTCIELTEDDQVFVVMHGVLRDSNLCFTEQHDTVIITEKELTSERLTRSAVPWITAASRDDTALELLVQVLFESGRLDDKTVGIAAGDTPEALEAALGEVGITPQLGIIDAPPGDRDAARADYAIVAQRFVADGVDFVFAPGDTGLVIEVLENAGLGAEYAFSDSAVLAAIPENMDNPALADGTVTVSFRPEDELWVDPDFDAACVEPFRTANPDLAADLELLPTEVDMAGGEAQWVVPIRRACYGTMLLKALGEAAGPELSNETLVGALDQIGPIEYPGWGQASYRADKWDGLDTFYLQEFDSTIGDDGGIRVVGDPIVVER